LSKYIFILDNISLMIKNNHLTNKKGEKMTKRERAEQVFRRLNVENRSLLLTYFEEALEAENSLKEDSGLTKRTGQSRADGGTGDVRSSRRDRPGLQSAGGAASFGDEAP
jgi:hypothetical protein